nr:hypothetical protein [Desulfitobacterium chlororespirans]
MSCIDKQSLGIHKATPNGFLKNLFKDALEDISSLKPPAVILAKGGEVGDAFPKVIPDKSTVGHGHFNVFNGLAHASNPIQMLYENDFRQGDRVDPFRVTRLPHVKGRWQAIT